MDAVREEEDTGELFGGYGRQYRLQRRGEVGGGRLGWLVGEGEGRSHRKQTAAEFEMLHAVVRRQTAERIGENGGGESEAVGVGVGGDNGLAVRAERGPSEFVCGGAGGRKEIADFAQRGRSHEDAAGGEVAQRGDDGRRKLSREHCEGRVCRGGHGGRGEFVGEIFGRLAGVGG